VKRILLAASGLLLLATQLPAQLKLPAYSKRTLRNGVTVYVMPRKGVPLVDIDIAIKGGNESDPKDQAGLAGVTGDLLRKGDNHLSADEFSETLDALGGTFRVRADEQSTLIQSEFLAKDFPSGLTLLSDAIVHPKFADTEVKKLLAQGMDDIKSLKDNPEQAIASYAHAFFFGPGHPYGRITDEASIGRITQQSIVDYHERMYTGNNIVIAVAGDVDADQAAAQVATAFESLPPGKPYIWTKPIPLAQPAHFRLLLVDKPGATQTYFYIAQPGIDTKNPDRTTLRLVNTTFGDRFTSMLNEELRIKSGLTYGARNIIEKNRLPGMNAISSFTRTDSTEQALDLSIATLKELNSNGLTSSQIALARAYVEGTVPRELIETTDQLARLLLRLDVEGLGPDEIDNMFQRLNAVTVDQANDAIKRYFQTSGLTFILLGDAAKIRPVVKKYAPAIEEISIKKPGFSD
jgi:zinc protease